MVIATNKKDMKLEELILEGLSNESPVVLYRMPGETSIRGIAQHDGELMIANDPSQYFQQRGFIISPYQFSTGHPEVFIDADMQGIQKSLDTKWLKQELPIATRKSVFSFYHSRSKIKVLRQNAYLNQCNTLIRDLQQDAAKKVILSRIHAIDVNDDLDVFDYFQKLCSTYSSAFCYLLFLPRIGIWMGATPELLLQKDSNRLSTMALAGTQRDEGIGLKNITWGEKEIEEQAMVSDTIASVFDKHFPNSYAKSETETVRAGKVLHLRTLFDAKLKGDDTDFTKLINDLHPTPAIAGLPRKEAQDIIHKIEKHKRGYYTGYLGPVNLHNDDIDLFVNLRCLELINERLLLYVGGGITSSSLAENEWEETMHKASTLSSVLLEREKV